MDEIFLKAIGVYNLGFFIFHIFFWKLFRWKKEMKKMSVANSAILQIANVQLIVYFLSMGLIFTWVPIEEFQSMLGLAILALGIGFWTVRLINQFVFLRVSSILVHILTGIFAIGVFLHVFLIVRLF